MANTIGVFDFDLSGVDRPGPGEPDLPMPTVHICLKRWSTLDHRRSPVISDELLSEDQIDQCVAQLKADLDAIGAEAKSAFRNARTALKATGRAP